MAAPALSHIHDPLELTRKRAVLFSARIQYGPETQPIREAAIDRLVEHDLLTLDCESGLTLQQLHDQSANNGFRVRQIDLSRSLERLKRHGRIQECEAIRPISYRLTSDTQSQLWDTQRASEKRLEKVLEKLFKTAPRGSKYFEAPFMYCISLIFAELGEAYARQLQGGSVKEEFLGRQSVAEAIAKASAQYCRDEEARLRAGVHLFFQDDDPEFVHVKWNLAQNFYVAKALGIDPSGTLLSKEVLGDTVLYLDTNVLISALTPIDATHKRFLSVSRVCAHLGIELKFCQISLDELRHTVATQVAFIQQMDGKVPRACSEKITNVFHMVYRHAQANNSPDLNSAFENFYNPIPVLTKYLAERVDHEWFLTEALKVDEDPILQKVRNACTVRPKGDNVARHDALLLKWVAIERKSSGKRIWLLTRDSTLPKIDSGSGSVAVTLDTLLQWIAPIAGNDAGIDGFEELFADAIRYQLLPQENFLEPRDFCLLLDLGLTCETLPYEDLEQCIQHLRAVAPGLNPSDPHDREQLHYRIAKFFADPGRKYHQELGALKAAKDREIEDLTSALEINSQNTASQAELIARLKAEITSKDDKSAKDAMQRSARVVASICAFVFISIEAAACFFSYQDGTGSWFHRISSAWPILTGVGLFLFLLSGRVIGRKQLSILGLSPGYFLFNDETRGKNHQI